MLFNDTRKNNIKENVTKKKSPLNCESSNWKDYLTTPK